MKLAIIFILVVGCSCNDTCKIAGIVVDKATNEPLDSVALTDLDKFRSAGYQLTPAYTKADGRFVCSCSPAELKKKIRLPFSFQKEGYGTIVEFFPRENASDTIYLQKKD